MIGGKENQLFSPTTDELSQRELVCLVHLLDGS